MADHFCGFVAVPIIVAVAFGWRVYMAMSAAGASNHQDYRSPSDYSKLAFPSYFWPWLASLVLISPTTTSNPLDWPPHCFTQPNKKIMSDAHFNDANDQFVAALPLYAMKNIT